MNFLKFLMVAVFLTFLNKGHADIDDFKGCENIVNLDVKVNCIKLTKMNNKLNRLINIIQNGNDGGYLEDARQLEYSCKVKVSYNKHLEGYGISVKDAQNNLTEMCKLSYSKSFCVGSNIECDYDTFQRGTHFVCEIHNYGRRTPIRGLGTTKKEALSHAIALCSSNANKDGCIRRIQGCQEKELL
tara:strand:- start:137 stop:694 length:558 start_codon:yes stop_codon:yes gene_type:complete